MNRIWLLIFLSLPATVPAQDTTRVFIFGHSLIDHRPPAIPTPSDETTVPHWVFLLAQESGHPYAAGGQYGFLPQHRQLPPVSQWGYDLVPGVWESDTEPFSEADIDQILITAGNFMQWQAPSLPYPGEPDSVTPILATLEIANWATQQEDSVQVFIYENWPDMAPYHTGGNFPPNAQDLANYYDYTTGDFHDWWLTYHDSLLIERPDIRMIPVGPILAQLLSTNPLNQIPAEELFEDDAPHGRASLYFLAGMITYSAMFAEPVPTSYSVPAIVRQEISDAYLTIRDTIWQALQQFTDSEGNNRVFFTSPSTKLSLSLSQDCKVYPNPVSGTFRLDHVPGQSHILLRDMSGKTVIEAVGGKIPDLSHLPDGLYLLELRKPGRNACYKKILLKQRP